MLSEPRIIEMRFVVEPRFHGLRLDHYLKRKIRRLSRTKIQTIIRTQLVGPGGRRMKPSSPVLAGDVLLLRRPARPEPPCPCDFTVLHDEPSFLVVDKPAGLTMHATARYYFNTLTWRLRERFPGEPLQICHRLDRETSGCVVVARGKDAASRLKKAFARRWVDKTYVALVYGEPPWEGEHRIDMPLVLATRDASRVSNKMMAVGDHAEGRRAVTLVTVLERHAGCSLVSCRPVTGRQHQIRAHLAACGFPIVGDKLYAHGEEAFSRFCEAEGELTREEIEAEFGLARQALHAAAITFPHPDTGAPVTVQSPIPSEFRAYIERSTCVA